MSTPLSLRLYGLATEAISPLAPAFLRARARRGKEDPVRLPERLGRASVARPPGELIWLHGVSVGESLSLLPLIERLRSEWPDVALLVTSGTRTSADLLAQRAPAGVIHQYAPVDTPGAVARFLDHWRPGLGLFAESELWPNLILEARRRNVTLALVSARITQKTARGWSRDRGAARALLGAFALILPQDQASAQRITDLGGRVDGALNLKLAAPALNADEGALASLRAMIGERNVILGASTHAPEEAMLASAVRRMNRPAAAPLLIIAPRHPGRGVAIAQALTANGARIARRAAGEMVTPEIDVYVADTMGEMGLFYGVADVAVMGGSFFSGVGGHNPLEPVRLGVPVVCGHDLANFAEVYAQMLAEPASAVQADGEAALTERLDALMADAALRHRVAEAGLTFAERKAGELDLAWKLIAPLLPARAT